MRSCQTRPNSVSNRTVCHAVVEKTRTSGNPLMFATSSQNQSRAERRAAIRLHPARRSKRCSTSCKSPLAGRRAGPSVTSSKIKVPASRIDAPMCAVRAMMSSAISINSLLRVNA
ncbi:MAG: hypothetical protein DMF42_09700 [Verrucomicrobia bacterium]|nr:MAG: hypothetical protein DMF42_09700 [Verrucomicrobiota bacterium]